MPQLVIAKRVTKFIQIIPLKHKTQIADKIAQLVETPIPHDSETLVGYEPKRRCDCGEYRIIYTYDKLSHLITIILVGKRNDHEVYKRLKRLSP